MAEKIDPLIARLAKRAGLVLSGPDDLTIRREPRGKGFCYRSADGSVLTGADRKRLASLAVPPAHKDVRLAPDPRFHIQAVGIDDAGRLQYRYHEDWREVREAMKAERLRRLIDHLPRIRRAVMRDLEAPEGSKARMLAAAVRLIDVAHVRAGNERYNEMNGSFGTATLLKKHADVHGDKVDLSYTAKGGKAVEKHIEAPKLAKALKAAWRLKGKRLFQYVDEDGKPHPIRARDINEYLANIAGEPVTAKDFRTLAASAMALEELVELEPADTPTKRNRQVAKVVKEIAGELANTPSVARNSYVHDAVVQGFESGALREAVKNANAKPYLSRAESALGLTLERAER